MKKQQIDVKRFHVSSQGYVSAYGNEIITGIARVYGPEGIAPKMTTGCGRADYFEPSYRRHGMCPITHVPCCLP